MQSLKLSNVWPLIKQSLECDISLINSMTDSVMQNKGKAIRSELLLGLAHSGNYELSVETINNLLHCCAIIEMIHTGTLVHDDVIDTSMTRRGKLSNHEIFGNTCSVLMGDYLFTKAFSLAFQLTHSQDFLQILAKTTEKLVEGELLQIQFNNQKELNFSTYERIVECKTAYLFSLSTESLGLFVEPYKRDELHNLGKSIGILFQVVDDYLDYFSTPEILGKPLGSDFKERKITHPLLIASEQNQIDINWYFNPNTTFEEVRERLSRSEKAIIENIRERQNKLLLEVKDILLPTQAIAIEKIIHKIVGKIQKEPQKIKVTEGL